MRFYKQLLPLAVLAVAILPLKSAAQTAATPVPQDAPSGITVTDARAKPETTEWLGWLSSDCNTGIRRLGDEKTSPPRLAVLQSDLRAALGDKYAQSSLLVTKYSIFANMSHWVQSGNPGAHGVLGSVLVANGCTKEETIGGWYSADEVTNDHAPVIIEIEASLDGKPVSARIVYSTEVEIIGAWGLFGSPGKAQAALLDAMRQADAKLIEQIRAL